MKFKYFFEFGAGIDRIKTNVPTLVEDDSAFHRERRNLAALDVDTFQSIDESFIDKETPINGHILR